LHTKASGEVWGQAGEIDYSGDWYSKTRVSIFSEYSLAYIIIDAGFLV
jgi:hypothetical protein